MSNRADSRRMTVEQLYAMPDDGQRYELAHGLLAREPPPGIRHGCVAMRIGALLDAHVRAHRLPLIVSADAGFVLQRSPDTVRAPDLAVIRRDRYVALQDQRLAMPGAPELAVEVLSPGNRSDDTRRKVADYLAAGAALVWVVDADQRQVQVYRATDASACYESADVLTAPELLPGFALPVLALFEL